MMSGPDPMTGGEDPNAMGVSPETGGEPIGEDPMAGGPMDGDPMGGGPMDGGPMDGGQDDMAQGGELDDDTVSIIKQLSPTDREAVRSYAESMLSRDETANVGQEQQQPMMEMVIFTKGQLNKLNEEFGPNRDYLYKDDEREEGPQKKKTKTTSNNSPFNGPKFK